MTIPRVAIGLLGAVGLNAAMILWTVVEHYSGHEQQVSEAPVAEMPVDEVQSAADVPPALPLPLPDPSTQSQAEPNTLSLDALRQLDPQFLEMAAEVYPELNQQPAAAANQTTQAATADQLIRLEQRLATVHNLISAALGLAHDANQSAAGNAEFVQRRQQMIAELRAMAAELLME